MKLAAHQPMAKKKTAKKAARRKAAKKRPAKKVASRVRATFTAPAAPTEEVFPDDLEVVPPDGVVAADQVDAMPAEAQAQREVEQAVEETGAGLPAVEAQATQAGGLGELAVRRELIWLIGPARRPRTAIVGRALSDGRWGANRAAVSNETAMRFWEIADVIQRSGPHHLRPGVPAALANYERNAAGTSRTLAGLLDSAVRYLGAMNVLQLATQQGMFLVGDGPVIFEGWPEWDRIDDEPPALRRPGRQRASNPPAPAPQPPALGGSLLTPGLNRRITLQEQTQSNAPPPSIESGLPRRRIMLEDDPPAGSTGGSSGAGP